MVPEGTEHGLGPQRTVYAATPAGSEAAQRWLHTPVEHVRDIRSHLLLKLALLDRTGGDPTDLLRGQRAVLEPIAEAIEDQRAQAGGFDATLLAWRRATAVAALDFLDRSLSPRRRSASQDGPKPTGGYVGANDPRSCGTRPVGALGARREGEEVVRGIVVGGEPPSSGGRRPPQRTGG